MTVISLSRVYNQKWQKQVNSLARSYSLSPVDAEDIVQEAWISTFDKFNAGSVSFEDETRLVHYVYSACCNGAKHYFRDRAKAEPFFDDDNGLIADEDAVCKWVHDQEENEQVFRERIEHLRPVIAQLPERHQQLVNDFWFAHKSYAEIAAELGYKSADVPKSQMYRITKQLYAIFVQQEKAGFDQLSPVDFLWMFLSLISKLSSLNSCVLLRGRSRRLRC